MTMFKRITLGLLALVGTTRLLALDPEVQKILDRHEAARPTDQSLAFYGLDWAPSLPEAKARAKKEGRPIFFIWLTNISASTSFFTGHC